MSLRQRRTNCGCTERQAPRVGALLFSSWPSEYVSTKSGNVLWRDCLCVSGTRESLSPKKKVQKCAKDRQSPKKMQLELFMTKNHKNAPSTKIQKKSLTCCEPQRTRAAAHARSPLPHTPARRPRHRRPAVRPQVCGGVVSHAQTVGFSVFSIADNSENLPSAKKTRVALTRD